MALRIPVPHNLQTKVVMSESRICAVIAEPSVESALAAMSRAAAFADLIELRLDYLRDFDFAKLESLNRILDRKPLPVILTCRAVEEGGAQSVDNRIRLSLLVQGSKRLADYCDIEAAHYAEAADLSPDPARLIISSHKFEETPADLDALYDRVTALPASIHKIVTRANTIADSLAIFRLLDRARRDGKQLIAMAMGGAGLMTRVLGPSRGSFLTYGSLAPGRESAPGQLTCEELTTRYRVRSLTGETAITGVIGSPVSQSASPAMHNCGFAALGLDFVYLPFEVVDLQSFFARFVRSETREIDWNLRGLSVTIPHKISVIPLLDELDPVAREVGAVNTVVIEGGRLIGYNTDLEGAMAPIARIGSIDRESFAVIGAGGAARALIYGLAERGARVTVFARDPLKAAPLGQRFGGSVLPLQALPSSDATVVINTTPVGMRGHSEGASPVPREALRGRRLAYDLIYQPLETEFLKLARAEGCEVINGLEMLVGQAALQFQFWTGESAPLDIFHRAAIAAIASQRD